MKHNCLHLLCKDRPKKLRKLVTIICWIFGHKTQGYIIIEPNAGHVCGRCGQIYKTEKLIYDNKKI